MSKLEIKTPVPTVTPLMTKGELSLADVLILLEDAKDLSKSRLRDMRSAINRLGVLLDRDLSILPANMSSLRHGINAIHPLEAGISAKTLQNIKSNVIAAFKHLGLSQAGIPSGSRLSPEWKALYDQLPSIRLTRGLSKFCRYCSNTGINPDGVTDTVMDDFMVFIGEATFVANLDKYHRTVCRRWNEAANSVESWPSQVLSVPASKKPDPKTPLSSLPASFQDETRTYLTWLADEDLFAAHRPPQKCKPSTIEQRRRYIGLAATALVERGIKRDRLLGLADITSADALKEISRYYIDKNDGEANGFLRTLIGVLIGIAIHWHQVDQATIHELVDIKKRLGKAEPGLTEKNKAFLRVMDDAAILQRLLDLPNQLAEEAIKANKAKWRAAVKIQTALIIDLFLMLPMRIKNMASLRLDQHILRPGGKDGKVYIALSEDEVKNEHESDFEVPPHLVERLDLYLSEFRPRLTDPENPYLFPGQYVPCKAPETIRRHLKDQIHKYTAIKMTAHQFRHLAAKIVLDNHPANYELVRRVLCHKNIRTTVNFYAGLDSRRAFKEYDAIILQLQYGGETP